MHGEDRDSPGDPGRVGPVALALGFAGLLPQVAAVLVLLIWPPVSDDWAASLVALLGFALAMIYAAVILSFLGGIWWGFAMQVQVRERQGSLAVLAVLPSLVAVVIVCVAVNWSRLAAWSAIAMGSAIMLTLLVDRYLVRTGIAPVGWMTLRVPLSLGLGGLTIVAGALAGG